MRAAVIIAEKEIEVTEIENLEADGKDVLIKVSTAGISGFDISMWKLGNINKGVTPGHEIVGTVEDVGSRKDLSVGDRVSVIPISPCMECDYCKEGNHNMCYANRNTPGKSVSGTKGTFAEYFLAKPYLVRKIPDNISDFDALMIAPASTAYHMVKAMNVKKGYKVLITGGGTMGALVAAWCHYFGAKFIGVIETSRHRSLSIMDYGHTTQIFDGNDKDPVEYLVQASGGFNVQFECSGISSYINTGIITLRRGSTIAMIGTHIKPAPINLYMLGQKLIRIVTFNAHTISDYDEVCELIKNKKFVMPKFTSKTISLDDVEKTFEDLTKEDLKEHKFTIKL